MENFDWTSFTRKIGISAPMQDIYDAWAISSHLENWFLEKATYKNNEGLNGASAVAGDRYEWKWILYDAIETGTVLEANGKDLFVFTFAGKCKVKVTLEEKASEIVISLTQSNIPTDDNSKRNIRLGCDKGWSFYLVNLKSMLEIGHDLRNKNEQLKGMLNT